MRCAVVRPPLDASMAEQPRRSRAWANASRLLDVPAARRPVGRRYPDCHGPVARERRANRVEHFEREPHAVLEAAAVLVVAQIGQRRQKLVEEIAVRAVELHRVEAEAAGARSCRRERLADAPKAAAIERDRRMVGRTKRLWRRRDRLPAAGSVRWYLGRALPRDPRRGLAAGVRELDRDRDVGPAADAVERPRERRFGVVRPEAEIARRNPALGFDRGRFNASAAPRRRAPGGRGG